MVKYAALINGVANLPHVGRPGRMRRHAALINGVVKKGLAPSWGVIGVSPIPAFSLFSLKGRREKGSCDEASLAPSRKPALVAFSTLVGIFALKDLQDR
ncbi:MAG: hypothetical protein Q8R28_11880, partial [Dehalococcoidia bacterium]|nr:hypothetical protein [Dehalococcoidia bacterium]